MTLEATSVGGVTCEVEIKNFAPNLLKMAETNISSALNAMATATVQRAKMLAPLSAGLPTDGNLRNSGRVESGGNFEKAAVFGNEIVPYARYQEFGDESWHYTTPGTGPHYLQDAGESVAKEGLKKYL